MPSVVQPGGDGDCGGVAALRKQPGRDRAAQRKPSDRGGTTRARTASSTCCKPERAGTKAAPEVKRTRAASSTRQGATPAMGVEGEEHHLGMSRKGDDVYGEIHVARVHCEVAA